MDGFESSQLFYLRFMSPQGFSNTDIYLLDLSLQHTQMPKNNIIYRYEILDQLAYYMWYGSDKASNLDVFNYDRLNSKTC